MSKCVTNEGSKTVRAEPLHSLVPADSGGNVTERELTSTVDGLAAQTGISLAHILANFPGDLRNSCFRSVTSTDQTSFILVAGAPAIGKTNIHRAAPSACGVDAVVAASRLSSSTVTVPGM
jgi:hypothetical protein